MGKWSRGDRHTWPNNDYMEAGYFIFMYLGISTLLFFMYVVFLIFFLRLEEVI